MKESWKTIEEWIRSGLAFDEDVLLADKELVPDEVVKVVRNVLKSHDEESLNSFEKEEDVAIYIDTVFLEDEPSLELVQKIVQEAYYFGIIRDNKCLITRGEREFDEWEHVEISNHSIDTFLSHVFHKDWALDFESIWKLNTPEKLIKIAEEWEKENDGIPFFIPVRNLHKLPLSVLMKAMKYD